jgi:hypothetical protein
MEKQDWLTRKFPVGLPENMLLFYLERLNGTMARIESKVNKIPDHFLSEKLDNKWSVKENIAHLAEVDNVSLRRIDEMIKGISPLSSAVVPLAQDYNKQTVESVIKFFGESRTAKLKKLETLSSEELKQASLHPRLKVMMTPIDLAFFSAEHDDHHLVRINEILLTLL